MKNKHFMSLSEIPDALLGLCLIVGIGASFGLLVFASFEINRTKFLETRETKIDDVGFYGNSSIQIKFPRKNTSIGNPVSVSGQANAFEATIRIRIKEGENVLANTFITADETGDRLYNFDRNISYSYPDSPNGAIEIFNENPETGKDSDKVIIPVLFKDYSSSLEWSTYEDEARAISFEYPSGLAFVAKTDSDISVIHKLRNIHNDPCIGTIEIPATSDDIIDLKYSLSAFDGSVIGLMSEAADLSDKAQKINRLNLKNGMFYMIDNTINNCGSLDYYYEIEPGRTIIIKRLVIAELKDPSNPYSGLSGIILPNKEEYIFNRFVSSLKNMGR